MIDVQCLPSMPPVPWLNHPTFDHITTQPVNAAYPHIYTPYVKDWSLAEIKPRGKVLLSDGPHTPPAEMHRVSALPEPSSLGDRVYKGFAAKSSAQSQTSLSRYNNTTKQPSVSASRPHSPVFSRDDVSQWHRGVRRRNSDPNAIVSYLQIPASINDSKGSLSEFAAQITCLFWFESSATLDTIEESRPAFSPVAPLVKDAMPSPGFRKWVTTILSTTQVTQNVILLALMFIYRLKKLNPSVKGKVGSEYRLLTVALMLGNKFLDDNTYTNKTWGEVSGISVQEIHIMEVEFLSNMRYTLYASEAQWKDWQTKLSKFWDYFNKLMTRVEPAKSFLPSTPMFSLPAPLPSPPASTHTSPAFLSNLPPKNHVYPHPLSFPPYLPPVPSPMAPLAGMDLRSYTKKRSYDEQGPESVAKRPTPSHSGSSTSSTTLTPSTVYGVTPPVPRLPIPNLSINTSGMSSTGYLPAPSSTHMPIPPGRAMSTVYPSVSSHWPQNGVLSTSQPQASFPSHGRNESPTSDQPRRTDYYNSSQPTSSPLSSNFPPHTPTHVSPAGSGILSQRHSPYKPIRGVNTLLVPPPSGAMYQYPQNVGYHQMHYQPLGRPISEQRTGVLPYMAQDAWWQQVQNMPQGPSMPQPNLLL